LEKMRKLVSIYSLITLGLSIVMWIGCSRLQKLSDEREMAESGNQHQGSRFDPLDLREDTEVVPLKYPKSDEIRWAGEVVELESRFSDTADSRVIVGLFDTVDTLNHQAYCIQLFTSKLYGEARRALAVAEEIFDRPVSLDYEVPYFKVRVGSFANREDAEDYQQRVKAAGYPDAWVVMVNVGVKEPASLYPEGTPPAVEDSVNYLRDVGPDD